MNEMNNSMRFDIKTSRDGFPVLTRPNNASWQGFSQFMDFGETLQELLDGPTCGLHILAGFFSHRSIPFRENEQSFGTDALIKGELQEHDSWQKISASRMSLAFGELRSVQSVLAMQTWYWFCRFYQIETVKAQEWLQHFFASLCSNPDNASYFITRLRSRLEGQENSFMDWFDGANNVPAMAKISYEQALTATQALPEGLESASRLISLFCLRHADVRWGKKDIEKGLFHPKVYVIERGGEADDSYVLMGSGNWSNSAFHANSEAGNLEIGMAMRLPPAAWQNCLQQPQADLGLQLVNLSRKVFDNCCPLASFNAPCADVQTMLKATRLPKDAENERTSELTVSAENDISDTYLEALAILKQLIFNKFSYEHLQGVLAGIGHYQEEGARRLVPVINRYNGAILADSTGLGKTWVAMRVITHYAALHNRFRVAIIAPNQVVENWKSELKNCQLTEKYGYHISVIEHGFLQQKLISEKHRQLLAADLVIIDESHNFRNAASRRSGLLRSLLKICPPATPGQSLKPRKTLLLTATPVNNSLDDLHTQAGLFLMPENELTPLTVAIDQEFRDGLPVEDRVKEFLRVTSYGPVNLGDHDLPEVKNPDRYFREETARLEEISKDSRKFDPDKPILGKIISQIGVRRNRQDCENIERNADASAPRYFRASPQQPERIIIDSQREGAVLLRLLSLFKNNEQTEGSTFAVHRWNMQKESDRDGRTSSSAGLQKILFLKRLESSSVAMLQTLTRLAGLHAFRIRQAVTENYIAADSIVLNQPGSRSLTDLARLWGISSSKSAIELVKILADLYADLLNARNDDEDGDIVQDNIDSSAVAEGQKALAAIIVKEFAQLADLVSELAVTLWGDDFSDWPVKLPYSGKTIWPAPAIWANMAVKDRKLTALLRKLCIETRAGRRVIVYSQFADTLAYIKSVIEAIGRLDLHESERLAGQLQLDSSELQRLIANTAIVTSDTDEESVKQICKSFAPYYSLSPFPPVADNRDETRELRNKWQSDWEAAARQPVEILLASDIMAEGVNLQDVATLINFDLHWNPVRMIQRAGRIDRRIKPAIEEAVNFPELVRIEQEKGIKIPDYYWQGKIQQAPSYVNFILSPELENELRLCLRLARKSLAIKGTIGLDCQIGIPDEDIDTSMAFRPITPDSFQLPESPESNLFNQLLIRINSILNQNMPATCRDDYPVRILRHPEATDSDPWLISTVCVIDGVRSPERIGLTEPYLDSSGKLLGLIRLSEDQKIYGFKGEPELEKLPDNDYEKHFLKDIDYSNAEAIIKGFIGKVEKWSVVENEHAVAMAQKLVWYVLCREHQSYAEADIAYTGCDKFIALNIPKTWLSKNK